MTAPNGDPMVGRTVAQYQILARAGGGGMGVVYRARDAKLGRTVALKFLPQQWSHDEGAKQRFLREAQAASATNHPNICTIHDFQTSDDGQLFIVMAYYEGQTLKQRLEAGQLPIEEALDIATQVADGLAKAHAQGIVHRDIKPGNLMLTEDGVRILDFGLATFADALKLTVENSTLGTAAYMSPEQARGQSADARSDVWAVGVVLYEMLTGHVPFQGSHAEAIGFAIRNEAPTPLRSERPEVSEDVERLVFRALHKESSIRYQSGRELARALRQVRGLSLPLDLRTESVPAPGPGPSLRRAPIRRWRGRLVAAACVILAAGAWGYLWLVPVERIPIAITSVVNLTGYSALDPYLPGLTEELNRQLRESRNVRPVPSERVRQILHPFRVEGGNAISRTAISAITAYSGSGILIVPALVHENGTWRARAEVRNATTATNEAVLLTASVTSALVNETAYTQTAQLAAEIDDYFLRTGPRRARVADFLRRLTGAARGSVGIPRMKTLDVAAAFEQGLQSYDLLEYAAAEQAFARATEQEPGNPLPMAWRSRVALLSRKDSEAQSLGEQAIRLTTGQTPRWDATFVRAVAAEARGDLEASEAQYRELVNQSHGEVDSVLELAAFLARRNRGADAIGMDHRALATDPRAIRAHLDLCRLYNPSELANAKQHGEIARDAYRAVKFRPGEAQALFCLVDVLRRGTDQERQEARRYAEAALDIFKQPGYEYNLPRAYNYLALAVGDQRRFGEAAVLWEKSREGARRTGNRALESLVLMNLGVAHEALGNGRRALEYSELGATVFQALGQDQRAAEQQANAAAIRIEYGDDPDQGFRLVQNAQAVSSKLGNSSFEVLAEQVKGVYHRNSGRYDEAERRLSNAINLAKQRSLDRQLPSLNVDLARVRFARGDYAAALEMIGSVVSDGGADARIWLARVQVRVGDFAAARSTLGEAEQMIQQTGETGLLPLLHVARGELAYESDHVGEARRAFAAASALWTDDLPSAASVEGRAYLGLLGEKSRSGSELVEESLRQAGKMRRPALEALCRVFLARIFVGQQAFARALDALDGIPSDDGQSSIGPELQAMAHYWRSRAIVSRNDRPNSQQEMVMARTTLEGLRRFVPTSKWVAFASRPDIRAIVE